MQHLKSCLWEFHLIYDFGAVWDKDEFLDFEVKGEGHSKTKYTFPAEA